MYYHWSDSVSLKHHQLGKCYPLRRDQSSEKPRKVMGSLLRAPRRTQHPKRTISLPSQGLREQHVWGFPLSELTHWASATSFCLPHPTFCLPPSQNRSCGFCSRCNLRTETLNLKREGFSLPSSQVFLLLFIWTDLETSPFPSLLFP